MNGDGCSDDEDEEEVRSHISRGSARSDAAPEGALVLNEDSMDSDRGGALNLVSFYLWNYVVSPNTDTGLVEFEIKSLQSPVS